MDTMQRMYGCLIDVATGDVVDAGLITIGPAGHVLVAHFHKDGSQRVAPYLPNGNRAVLTVPAISPN